MKPRVVLLLVLFFSASITGLAVLIRSSSVSQEDGLSGQLLDVKWDSYDTTSNGWDSDEQKKLKIFYFGFLSCPDVCPLALRNLKSVAGAVSPEDLKRIRFVFVTLDPERDTIKKLDEALGLLHKDFVGIRPREEQIAQLAAVFMFQTERIELSESALRYVVSHPNRFYFVDSANRLIEAYGDSSIDGIMGRIREFLGRT